MDLTPSNKKQCSNSRERVIATIEHHIPDRIPFDLGSLGCTGIHAQVVIQLRKALGLPPLPPRVTECYGMMGEIAPDMANWFELDTVGLLGHCGMFGFPNDNWKRWRIPSGYTVSVPGKFNTRIEESGSVFQYPQGDGSCSPCARMPANGLYFDHIDRQMPINDSKLDPHDNGSDFAILEDEDLLYLQHSAEQQFYNTDKAIIATVPGTAFGDVALVPAPWLKQPKGIRNMEEWYMSLCSRRDYIYEAFSIQCEIALKNLELTYQAVGDKVQIILVSGTDFGGQSGQLISNDMYCDLFKPFHIQVNGWIHKNTKWKTLQHCCGSVEPLISEFIKAGFDAINPVQFTAANMEPTHLKKKYGEKICFWGGGVDTQRILQFGSPEEVDEQVRRNVSILRQGGGFVFTPVHNIQPGTPIENIVAMVRAFHEIR